MRKKAVLFIAVMLLFVSSLNYGQDHELIIEPFETSQDFLQNAILGDTTSTGERVDPDRVYVLRRGGVYYQDSRVIVEGFDLHMKAEEGTDPRPKIQNIQGESGAYDSRMYEVIGNTLDLSNLVISNWFDEDPETLPDMQGHIIDGSGEGNTILVDNCVLEGGYSATLRVNAASHYVRVTNTVFGNSGNGLRSNLGNGRAIDFRTTSVDSVFIQNCSFINVVDRAVRHYGGSQAPIRNFTFDHNTIVNDMATHGCLGLGLVEGYVKITNNLLVDPFIFGNDSLSSRRLEEFGDTGERGPSGVFRMTLVGTVPNSDTISATYTVNNNFYSVSPAVQTIWDQDGDIAPLEPLTWFINSQIGADSADALVKLQTPITFMDAPATPTNMLEWYLDPARGNRDKDVANFTASDDFDRKSLDYFASTVDLKYDQSSPAFTGAEGGLPAGDLNWWEGIVAVEREGSIIPETFSLEQNFPNPFNPATKIVYNVPKESKMKLEVFDILGRIVATLVNETQSAGKYTVDFDASELSSGVYVYQLTTQHQILSKKMMLLK